MGVREWGAGRSRTTGGYTRTGRSKWALVRCSSATLMFIPADYITTVKRLQRGPMQRAEWRNRVFDVRVPRISRVDDRYGSDVLARDPHSGRKVRSAELPIELGMVVEDAQTGYVGARGRLV